MKPSPADSAPAAANAPEEISLNGNWKFLPEGDRRPDPASADISGWETMPVPSNWFLRGKKGYPGDGQGLDLDGGVWFARDFSVPEKYRGRHISLRFGMVDYSAEVYLNGAPAGRHVGCFQEFSFPVETHLRFGGPNRLLVRVESPRFPVDFEEKLPRGWPKRQSVVKGVFGYHDARPGGTGPRGQEGNTGGIVGDVALRITGTARVESVRVTPRLSSDGKEAALTIQAVFFNASAAPADARLEYGLAPANFEGPAGPSGAEPVTLPPGRSEKTFRVAVSEPRLWWSWDHGDPNLYFLDCRLIQDGAVSDEKRVRFGIRTFERGEGWKCRLNGRLLYTRGSNYISTQWLSEMDREEYLRDVRLMREAHLNAIRVHAHVEKDGFYDACDELGVMVWQDFPLQWGYTDEEDFVRDAVRQIGDMVEKLYNHPSVTIWCGHNESPYAMAWMDKKTSDQNRRLDDLLERKVKELDPTRHMHHDSGTGDGHEYCGWYVGRTQDFRKAPGGPLLTEYGAQALPSLGVLKDMFPDPKDQFPSPDRGWDLWAYHNFQKDQTFAPGRVEMGTRLEEFMESSQRYQAKMVKFATECYRRAKGPIQGVYHFMFTECWPSITWAVVDYRRVPKRGYHALKDAMQPLLPSIAYDEAGRFSLWVVNDFHRRFDGANLAWEVLDAAGRVTRKGDAALDIGEDSVREAADLGNLRETMLSGGSIRARIADAKGQVLGRNALEAWEWVDAPFTFRLQSPFARVTASSASGLNAPELAADGRPHTRWESALNADPQWIAFEFEKTIMVRRVTVHWDAAAAKEYAVEVSEDGNAWRTVAEAADGAARERRTFALQPLKARHLRVTGRKRIGNAYSIAEVAVE